MPNCKLCICFDDCSFVGLIDVCYDFEEIPMFEKENKPISNIGFVEVPYKLMKAYFDKQKEEVKSNE